MLRFSFLFVFLQSGRLLQAFLLKIVNIHLNNNIMRKILTLLLFMASMAAVMAQYRTINVYIPGPGEHRGGFSLTPAYGESTVRGTIDRKPAGTLSNQMGIGFEAFIGHETEHGRMIEWSSLFSIGIRYQSYSGVLTDTLNQTHDVSLNAPSMHIKFNEAMIIPVTDELHLGIGIEFLLGGGASGKARIDGEKYTAIGKESLIGSIFSDMGICLGATLEARYFFADNMYVAARLGYTPLNIDISASLDDDKYTLNSAGVLNLSQSKHESYFKHYSCAQPFNMALQFGFRW